MVLLPCSKIWNSGKWKLIVSNKQIVFLLLLKDVNTTIPILFFKDFETLQLQIVFIPLVGKFNVLKI